jgi:hypothetical protein
MIEIINFYKDEEDLRDKNDKSRRWVYSSAEYVSLLADFAKKKNVYEWFMENCVISNRKNENIFHNRDSLMLKIKFTGIYNSRLCVQIFYLNGIRVLNFEDFLNSLSASDQVDLLFEIDTIK